MDWFTKTLLMTVSVAGLFCQTPVSAIQVPVGQLAKIATHVLCFGATAYWVSDHIEQPAPEAVIKTSLTLGAYMTYAPSIAICQATIMLRKFLGKYGIKISTPHLRKVLPIFLTLLAGGYVANLTQYSPDISWLARGVTDVHRTLGIVPQEGVQNSIVALLMALGIWYNITDTTHDYNG
jgi:hypothetical protein